MAAALSGVLPGGLPCRACGHGSPVVGHVGVMPHRPAIREIQCFVAAADPHRCDGR